MSTKVIQQIVVPGRHYLRVSPPPTGLGGGCLSAETSYRKPAFASEHSQSAIKELLNKLNFRFYAIQHSAAREWWNFDEAICTFSRLWLVLAGQATIHFEGGVVELSPGDVYLIPATVTHSSESSDNFEGFDLHFSPVVSAGVDLFSLLDCPRELPTVPGEFHKLFERLMSLSQVNGASDFASAGMEPLAEADWENHESDRSLADWLEIQAVLRLLLTPFLATAQLRNDLHSQVAHQFPAVQEFIDAHLAEPIVLADLARVTGLHPTYFSHRFQQMLGLRPLEYLMRRRIERAQHLLVTSHASIKEVTYDVGLRDPAYFSRVFLKYCRLSPSAYRIANGA